jgi:hypothetical protein
MLSLNSTTVRPNAPRAAPPATRRGHAGWWVAGGLGLALYLPAVWFDWLPWLRGWRTYPEGWNWGTYPIPPLARFLPVLAWMAVLCGAVLLGTRLLPVAARGVRARVGRALVLALLVLSSYGLQIALLGLKDAKPQRHLVVRVTKRVFTSYFTLAAAPTTHLSTFFRDYPAVFNTKLCPHCHEHPPGPALFYWLVLRGSASLPAPLQHDLGAATRRLVGDSPALAALQPPLTDAQFVGAVAGGNLVLLLAATLVLPLYGLARLLAPRAPPWWLAGLAVAVPGVLLMAPEFDQGLGLVTAGALYCGLRGLRTSQRRAAAAWAGAAGIILAVGLFFTWAPVVLFGVFVGLGFLAWGYGRSALFAPADTGSRLPARQVAAWLAAFVVGTALVELVLTVGLGFDLPYVLQYNLNNAAFAEARRPYAVWIFFGPLDFLQFLGLPLALAALAALVLPARAAHGPAPGAPLARVAPWLSRINPYAALFWGLLLAIDLAGRTKAEQGRLLLYLAPLALVAVYVWVERTRPDTRILAAVLAAQLLVTLVLGARWFVP